MAMTVQQFIELEGNVRHLWDAYFKKKTDLIKPLYNYITDSTAQITDVTMGAPGRMSDWTGSVAYDTLNIGYSYQVRPDKKSTGIQIDRDMWEDKEYRGMKTYINNEAYGVDKTLRYDSAIIFNNAFGTIDLGGLTNGEVNADFSNSTTGPKSENINRLEAETDLDLNLENKVDIDNDVDLDVESGNNEISENTLVGDIETGDVTVDLMAN
jgi:hypothetical protein